MKSQDASVVCVLPVGNPKVKFSIEKAHNNKQIRCMMFLMTFDNNSEMILLISSQKPMLWILIRITSPR